MMRNVLRKIKFVIHYHLFHKHKLSRTIKEKVNGVEFLVYPSVFNPVSYYSSRIFAKFVPGLELKGKNVLDMGCGSGVIGIFAASKGANVTAVDKNPEAVRCTTENASRNNISIKVFQSDLYSGFPSPSERGAGVRFFDFIFFNPPYYPREPETDFELGFNAGKDLRVINDFLMQSTSYLADEGVIYLIVSSDIGIDGLINIFNRNGFAHNFVTTKRKLFETFYIIRLTSPLSPPY